MITRYINSQVSTTIRKGYLLILIRNNLLCYYQSNKLILPVQMSVFYEFIKPLVDTVVSYILTLASSL